MANILENNGDIIIVERSVSTDNSSSFPDKEDALLLFRRLYKDKTPLNCARSLDHNLVVRIVIRNSGQSVSVGGQGGSAAVPLHEAITFPSAKDLYNLVWGLIPAFMRDRIAQWAADNKEGTIAQEITEYVKQALGLLPIPVPGIFVNAAANLIIPPLVTLIIAELAGDKKKKQFAEQAWARLFAAPSHKAGESHVILRDLDRDVLRFSGLPTKHLPTHLRASEGEADDDDDEDMVGGGARYPCLGQPDRRAALVVTKQFYQDDTLNGCKPMQLSQVVAAQIRANSRSDEEVRAFGPAVWDTLTKDQKTQLRTWANEQAEANRHEIAKALYDPVFALLAKEPYLVPAPIRSTFASMKVPEVTEWVVKTYRN